MEERGRRGLLPGLEFENDRVRFLSSQSASLGWRHLAGVNCESFQVKVLPGNERWLRACQGRFLQRPRFFANANQIILYRASGRRKQRPSSSIRIRRRQFLGSQISQRGRGRPSHNVGRASSPVRLLKTAWKWPNSLSE